MTVVSDFTALISEYSLNGTTTFPRQSAFITYSFDTAARTSTLTGTFSDAFINSFRAFDDSEKAVARAAIKAWSDVSGVTFLEVPSGQGDMAFGLFDLSLSTHTNAAGFAYYPSMYASGDFTLRSAIGSDVFIDLPYGTNFEVISHEIGHALGLKHPFEGATTLETGVDNKSHTVMSYTNDLGEVTQLGQFDVEAVRYLYGTTKGGHLAGWSWNATTYTLYQAGTENADTIMGVATADIISGRGGDDNLASFEGDDTVAGGEGNDRLCSGEGNDKCLGDNGDDFINASLGHDQLDGGAGNDVLWGDSGNDTIVGGAGDDVITGDDDIDTADYSASTSAVKATLSTYDIGTASGLTIGTDELYDIENLIGGSGSDTLTGSSLGNQLEGRGGNDLLDGAAGADTLVGGTGNDTYVLGAGDTLVELATGGIDTIRSAVLSINLSLFSNIESAALTGAASLNLTGDAVANTLAGNSGANLIAGREGHDVLSGGAGRDNFLFNTKLNAAANVDRITDFNVADDTIRLENTGTGLFTALAAGTLAAAKFKANASGTATDSDDRIIYNTATGDLIYDTNGSAAGGAIKFATLANKAALTAADFLVI